MSSAQIFLEVRAKIRGGNALECKMVKVVFQELIEHLAAVRLFQRSKEERALLIRDTAEAFIGITAGKVNVKNLVPGRQVGHLLVEVLLAEHRLHVGAA